MTTNSGFDYSEQLGAETSRTTLLTYLTRKYRHTPEEQWRERIATGRVLLDGAPAAPDTLLRPGQLLCWRRPAWHEPQAPCCFAVLFEDRHLLAVAKPAGLPSLPGAGFLRNTLLALVRERCPEAAPMHRLGRWTSGLVLCGRTREARAELARTWRTGQVVKRYRALASGQPEQDEFSIDAPIGPVPHETLGSVHAATHDGKASFSRVRVRKRRRDAFLADVEIETGRPHQIRIHLAAAGFPLVGDPLYARGGRPLDGCTALPGDPGYRLHAAQLKLAHPVSGVELDLRCAPPPWGRVNDGSS